MEKIPNFDEFLNEEMTKSEASTKDKLDKALDKAMTEWYNFHKKWDSDSDMHHVLMDKIEKFTK